MQKLVEFLDKEGYTKIPFKVSKTKHLLIKATVNGVSGNFILDTGASNSCVGFESIPYFNLIASNTENKATGAGGTGIYTQLSKYNKLKVGKWKTNQFHLVIFELSHVNEALKHHKIKPIHGIIGADILLEGKGIVDYSNHLLFLK
jgi:hypothetical protein